MSWLYLALLAGAVAVFLAAEWPRVAAKLGIEGRRRRERARQKAALRLLRTDSEEFAASVERDLEKLPTIEERDTRRR